MSKERLNCEDICPNYYSSWEEGSCMECCEFYNHDECPVVYVNGLEKQIADLEAKLAEHNEYFRSFSCEDFNEFQDFISTFMLTPHEEQTLIRELKQQLAEKDDEIERLQIANGLGDKLIQNWKEIALSNQQDKISFAVEQLEKVKEFVVRQLFITTKDCSDLDEAEAKGCNELREETIKEIDNQIKQLKEGK